MGDECDASVPSGSGLALDEPGPALIAASAAARRNERLRVGLCLLLVLLGVSVGTGWLMQIAPLKSIVPGFSTMKFNTAVGFVAVGAGSHLPGRSANR